VDYLKSVAAVRQLEAFAGFDRCVSTFRNPTHTDATFYEAFAALWCARRAATTDIELAPEIPDGAVTRYPDFVWRTGFGDLLVECNESGSLQDALSRRVQRCLKEAEAVTDNGRKVPEGFRLDVRLGPVHLTGIEGRVRKAAIRCLVEAPGVEVVEGEVVAVLRPKSFESVREEPSLIERSMVVEEVVGIDAATLEVSCPASAGAVDAVRRLFADARRQLPKTPRRSAWHRRCGR
jgi:hypothetical protein